VEISLNQTISVKLNEMADILEQQSANPFRIRAYRRAADTLSALEEDVSRVLERKGPEGLIALPNIGKGIAASIAEMAATGRWGQLDRLRGNLDPVHLFRTVPGIGPDLAKRIHEDLHLDTLEALETAAYDGRLERVRGMGSRRISGLRASLSSLLGRPRRRSSVPPDGPAVALLLDIDRIYLEKSFAGELPLITPRRFNPKGVAWLPILHMEKDGWHFTAMYSNTARAHQLDKTRDWVIIYFYDEHHQEGQHTIVTETHGPLQGRRVVRGREEACLDHYSDSS
jgi:putative hydrolase